MDCTSKMVALLGAVRKEMNGAALDTLRYYGADYGLNYGAPITALRAIAKAEGKNDELARFLYRQQVRELRVIALWIADPAATTVADFAFWAEGIINSEVAEQAAQALLSRIADADALLAEWCDSGNALLAYAAMLAASRSTTLAPLRVYDAVRCAFVHWPDNHLVVQGAVALLSAVATRNNERESVRKLLADLAPSPTVDAVRDELSWRLEY
ncbi:MAG: DNA alkylation repair protein [Alistipes sp.]